MGLDPYVVIVASVLFPPCSWSISAARLKDSACGATQRNIEQFVAAFKKWVKFYGVTLIVFMSIYAVVIVVGIIVAVAASAR